MESSVSAMKLKNPSLLQDEPAILKRYPYLTLKENKMTSTSSMTLKDWVDLFTSGGAAISAIAAGVAAWAARTSARAAKESSEATRAAIRSNEKIADNDRRIRLMEERLKIWRAFDELMASFERWGYVEEELLKARESFQFAR